MIDLHGISEASFDLIVNEEVSGEAVYDRRYRHPEWPGESSGVTIGVGYDVGQAARAQFIADWKGKIPAPMLVALAKTCGVTGAAAAPLARNLWSLVDIPWETALDVFSNHDVPRYAAMMRRALPGVEALSPDCQGALLSIVFNRGASFSLAGPRYAEMRDIKACIKSGELARIPALIRSMERLWSPASGLHGRREREAALFEKGLQECHPEHFAALAAVPPVPDPEMVAGVQQRLRELGYYQVGAIDGGLTPHGRTEDAILAFRNKNGLPLTPAIDDDFLAALAKASPPEVADERANATADDLRAQDSETIGFTDRVKGWGGRLFGGGTAASATGLLAVVSDKATAISNARDAVGGLGLTTHSLIVIAAIVLVLAVCAGAGLLIWYVADRIEQRHVADYRSGKHP
jgi:hypothetical protein